MLVFPFLAALSSTLWKEPAREFRFFTNDGDIVGLLDQRPVIACDGRIPQLDVVNLELSHWEDNKTPREYFADTSTEMALLFAESNRGNQRWKDALVVNNHYDTDGALSVFACLDPDLALQYKSTLIDGAEAGDFGEWSSDNGMKLDLIVSDFLRFDEEDAFHEVLDKLPSILKALDRDGGEEWSKYWRPSMELSFECLERLENGDVTLKAGPGSMAILSTTDFCRHALHRGLLNSDLWGRTNRILRVGGKGVYRYESVGHGWVKNLRDRHVVPSVDKKCVVKLMNSSDEENLSGWSVDNNSLVSICQTVSCPACLNDVAQALSDADDNCRS